MTAAEIRDPMGDTRKGAEITAKETCRRSITGTAQYSVVDVMEVEMGTTVEEVVRKGVMVQTETPPPHHQDGQKTRGGRQTNCKGGTLA